MSRTGFTLIAAGALVLGLGFAGPAAQAQDVVKIGAGAPLTGQIAKPGQEVANAVKLAADDWNKKGGVLGKKIEVVEADDQGNPQVGVAAAEINYPIRRCGRRLHATEFVVGGEAPTLGASTGVQRV